MDLCRCFYVGARGANYEQRTRKEGKYVSQKLGPAYGASALPVATASEASLPVQQFHGFPRQAYIAHPLQPPSRNATPPNCLPSNQYPNTPLPSPKLSACPQKQNNPQSLTLEIPIFDLGQWCAQPLGIRMGNDKVGNLHRIIVVAVTAILLAGIADAQTVRSEDGQPPSGPGWSEFRDLSARLEALEAENRWLKDSITSTYELSVRQEPLQPSVLLLESL